MKNIFYFNSITSIGGVESFFYYLSRKYKDKDITIYCKQGNEKQLQRLRQYVRVKKFRGEKIKCEKAFFNYNLDIIDNVEAKEYIQVIHTDYKKQGLTFNKNSKITKYIGVTQEICNSFKEMTGLDCELCYNPIEFDEPKKVLKLISATRLTKEKGKKRIEKLGQMLNTAKIPYIWTVFTNSREKINNPNIIFMNQRLDIIDYIADADYLVQLSDDGEGYGYTTAEALSVGTPVIVTPNKAFLEIGVKDGENGFVIDFDMNNVDIDKIYKSNLSFEYKPPADSWDKLLAEGKSYYKEEMEMKYLVRATNKYIKTNTWDSELSEREGNKVYPEEGREWEVSYERKEKLVELGFVTVVKEIKDEIEGKSKEVKTEVIEEEKKAEDVKEEKKTKKNTRKKKE